jgi:hypothetical protein
MGHADPADFSMYVGAVAVGTSHRFSSVFCVTQKYLEFLMAIQATKFIIGHTYLDKNCKIALALPG